MLRNGGCLGDPNQGLGRQDGTLNTYDDASISMWRIHSEWKWIENREIAEGLLTGGERHVAI